MKTIRRFSFNKICHLKRTVKMYIKINHKENHCCFRNKVHVNQTAFSSYNPRFNDKDVKSSSFEFIDQHSGCTKIIISI